MASNRLYALLLASAACSPSGGGFDAGAPDMGVPDVKADAADASYDAIAIDGANLVTLATGLKHPIGLAVDGKEVFWVDADGTVMKCSVVGCSGAPIALATGQTGAGQITIDVLYAYWMTSSHVVKCSKAGCQGAPSSIVATLYTPEFLAVDSTNVYWSEDQRGVTKCSLDGGTPTSLVGGGSGVAVDATNVYITNTGGLVSSCSIAGCGGAPTTLALNQTLPSAITVDATDVYWVNYDPAGTIMKCAKGGCGMSPTTLASAQKGPATLAVDDTNVYWVNYDGGELMRCAKTGCAAPTVLVSGLDHPVQVAVDSSSVYWTNSNAGGSQGSVMRLTPK